MDGNIKTMYFSATGTTARTVKAISSSMGKVSEEYDITLPNSRKANVEFSKDDIVVLGVPVYAGRVPEFLEDFISNLEGNGATAVAVAVYGNRDYDDALLELRDMMEKSGFLVAGAGAFIGEHSYSSEIASGRPDDMDIALARSFGEQVSRKLEECKSAEEIMVLGVKGNYPYKERGSIGDMSPDTSESCIECGQCAENCPVGAISMENFRLADDKKCIKCHRCIKICPAGAKSLDNETMVKFRTGLVERVGSGRKEPEIFV